MTKQETSKLKIIIGQWLVIAKQIKALESDGVIKEQNQVNAVQATSKTYEQCAIELAKFVSGEK